MKRFTDGGFSLGSIPTVFVGIFALGVLTLSALADPPKSLLPEFGTKGRQIDPKGKAGYDIRGWLPMGWMDNSSWAPVSVMYSELKDAPSPGVGAVRMEVMKVDKYQVQLTTGARNYKQGSTYVVTGWVRSPVLTGMWIGFRQDEEPHEFFLGRDLDVDTEWKRFSVEWTPDRDCAAWLLFNVPKAGTVDLAGIVLEEKP